jgi:hypothetical protein
LQLCVAVQYDIIFQYIHSLIMKQVFKMAALAGTLLLASCFGQHNSAPNEGINLEDTRIYGEKGADPVQLKNKPPEDDGTMANRSLALRDALFPKTGAKTDSVAVAAAVATAKAAAAATAPAVTPAAEATPAKVK